MKSPPNLNRPNRVLSKVEGLSRISLQVYDFLIFDCDGVILDSNSIKSEAFRHSLTGYPSDAVDELMEFHHQNGGISRYVKFEYFFGKILGSIAFEQELENVLNHFQTYVFDRLIECPLVPGIEEILIYLSNQQKRCFVISGADEVELHQILSAHGLNDYFETVFGSPATKTEIMRVLFKSTGMSPHKGLFFGDSEEDFRVCGKFDIECILVTHRTNWKNGSNICRKLGGRQITDFTAIR